MTRNKIEQFLHKNFEESQRIEDNIFRCQKTFHDQPYQVLYLDFTDKWLDFKDSTEDLEQYLENIIQSDYYRNEGYLQWNYYYTFISKSDKINNNNQLKDKIERDQLYARKYIMTLTDFEDWLSKIEKIGKYVAARRERNLAAEWINKLRNADLDAVFMKNITYDTGVEEYIKGTPKKEPEKQEYHDKGQTKVSVESNLHIKKIELLEYLDYPVKREYDFGKVNLIEGVNGSGKTSLLEAIELLFCGKTKRNYERDNSRININVLFEGDHKKKNFVPLESNNKLYKERDKSWYNSIVPRNTPSKIYEQFNRFNFFNSDAAYFLSHGKQTDMIEAFEDIALGVQVNWLEDRLLKFRDRFNKELKISSKEIKEYNKDIKKQKNLLSQIGTIDKQPEKLFEELILEAGKMKLRLNNAKKSDVEIILEKNITTAKLFIKNIESELKWLDSITHEKTKKELKTLETLQKSISQLLKQSHKIKLNRKANIEELNKLKEIKGILHSLEPYFKEGKISQLIGLQDRINDISSKLKILLETEKVLGQADLTEYNDLKMPLEDYENNLNKELRILESNIKEKIKKISEVKKNISELDKIVTEIKEKGKEFILLQKNATDCPLCHAKYPEGKLIELIEKTKRREQSPKNLGRLLEEKNKIVKKRERFLSEIENFSKLKRSFQEYYKEIEEYNTVTISNGLKEIKKELKRLQEFKNQLEQLKGIQQYFRDNGLKETKFAELKELLLSLNIQVENNKAFKENREKNKHELKSIQENINSENIELENIEKSIESKLEKVGISRDDIKLLKERIENGKTALKNYEELKEIISVEPREKLKTIEININKISEIFEKYKDLRRKKEERNLKRETSNKRIEELQQKIDKSKNTKENAERAYKTIDDILTNRSKSKFLENFIENNKNEIMEIFRIIHFPKEFEDLRFEKIEGISLIREKKKVSSKLSEISAGQRTALALSIFIALNQKLRNGPDILLFDDPVVNIDDLNILSFMDYLREIVTKSNKQVFFSTANADVAYLFKKKFGFLRGDEFKEFVLERK